MEQKLKPAASAALLAQLKNRFEELSNRERRLVMLMGAVIGLTLVWLVALAPAIEALTVTRNSLPDKQAQASRILALADTVAALRERGGSRGQAGTAPVETLQARLALLNWQDKATVEDRGDGVVSLVISEVPATDALEWLDNTERLSGLTLSNLTLEKISTGTVNVRSQWRRRTDTPGAGS